MLRWGACIGINLNKKPKPRDRSLRRGADIEVKPRRARQYMRLIDSPEGEGA